MSKKGLSPSQRTSMPFDEIYVLTLRGLLQSTKKALVKKTLPYVLLTQAHSDLKKAGKDPDAVSRCITNVKKFVDIYGTNRESEKNICLRNIKGFADSIFAIGQTTLKKDDLEKVSSMRLKLT